MSKEEQLPVIVPVTLHSKEHIDQQNPSKQSFGLCTITLDHAEITFHNGVEERNIQTIMRELVNR